MVRVGMTQPYALNPMNRISIGMPNAFYNEIIMSGEGCFKIGRAHV